MHILADENVPGDVIAALWERGHDVAWVWSDAPGSSDTDVLARAQAEGRVLVTFDKDFGGLAFRLGLPASSGGMLPASLWQPWKAEPTGRGTSRSSKTTAFAWLLFLDSNDRS